ncbi:MAG: ATP synthase subunit I [Myxococcota bacterium]
MISPRMLQYANLYQLLCVALASLGTLFWWPAVAVGTLAGGLLMAGNFWALRTLLDKLMLQESKDHRALWLALLGLKFFGVLGLMAIFVVIFELHPMGVALGMIALFVGIILGVMHARIGAGTPLSS